MSDNTNVPWRVGRSYGIHVYADDVSVATFHTSMDAAAAVKAHNDALRRGVGRSAVWEQESLRAERDAALAEVERLEDVARCPSGQELADARAEVADLLAAIERVKALHMAALSGDRANPVCVHDVQPWPCPTIRALEQP